MRHFFLIDPIEKLNIKKDSTFFMARTFKQLGQQVYLLFIDQFSVYNDDVPKIHAYDFQYEQADDYYLSSLTLGASTELALQPGHDVIHMRLDPPVDVRYIRALWMLDFLNQRGIRIVNNAKGILAHNEKLLAYGLKSNRVASFVGESNQDFLHFISRLEGHGFDEVVLKPLDLYSGIGVEKFPMDKNILLKAFESKKKEFNGAIVAQPFIKEVYSGEFRSIYFKGEELGSIIKKPKAGTFVSNIAQGSGFEATLLPRSLATICQKISMDLAKDGIDLIAFDLLGENITEVNITCPGLITEVSFALKENLAERIYRKL